MPRLFECISGSFRVVAIGHWGKRNIHDQSPEIKGGVFFKASGLVVKNH